MKIIFLCGGLEPGKDGVGDYTRRLASELIRQGVQAMVIAINDANVSIVNKGTQINEATTITVLRLPATTTWEERYNLIKQAILNFSPDWVSLQYVPFSFNAKGLPFGFAKRLKNLSAGFRWQIMFHELWVGIEDGAGLKMKSWAWLQRQLILQTIAILKPSVIHTQATIYYNLIRNYNKSVRLLPLFGNVPVTGTASGQKEGNYLKLVIFGAIHPGVPVEKFMDDLSKLSLRLNKRIQITFLGRNGGEQEKWIAECNKNNILYLLLNEQSTTTISDVLINSDFGITTNPLLFVEKSGTVAAMAEHGLKVISVSSECKVRKMSNSLQTLPYLYEYQSGSLNVDFFKEEAPIYQKDKVSKVANQFVTDLLHYEN